MPMKRQCVALSKPQLDFLHKEAKKLGISLSDLVRRIIDKYRTTDACSNIASAQHWLDAEISASIEKALSKKGPKKQEMIVDLPEHAQVGTKFVIGNQTGGPLTVRSVNSDRVIAKEQK